MKKLTILIVLGLLCLKIRGYGQDNIIPRGLQPGDKVPASAGLRVYGGKLVILDFWATWCAPCRALVPKADSLNRVFKGEALLLPVTYEAAKTAGPVLAQIRRGAHPGFPELFGDTVLHGLFPHVSLPHYVWVDGEGVVRAITESGAVTGENIRRALQRGEYPSEKKQDLRVAYDADRLLFMGGNGGKGDAVRYQSLLSGYVPGLKGGLTITRFDTVAGQRFTLRNVPLSWIFNTAYGEKGRWFIRSRIRNLSKDSAQMTSRLSGEAYHRWMASGWAFCYELLVPPYLSAQTYPLLQAEVAKLFPQYRVGVERQTVRCLALVRTGGSDALLASRGGAYQLAISPFSCKVTGAPLGQVLSRLERQFMQNARYPLVDMTGYAGPVDLDIKAKMSGVAELNEGLAAYGLKLVEQDAATDLLVIRDNPAYHPLQFSK